MHLPFVHKEQEKEQDVTPKELKTSNPQRTSRENKNSIESKTTRGSLNTTSLRQSQSTATHHHSTPRGLPPTSNASNNGNTSKSSKYAQAQRPGLQRRRTTARTRYIDMLLGLDAVPPLHNILASASVWILLAGYIVFPATFTKLNNKDLDDKTSSDFGKHALSVVRNVPLLYVAAFACGIGIIGCLCLWWKHRSNYVWVINRIFLPALLNSLAGFISTIVNVYSAQDGQYSVSAKVTVVVTASCTVVAAALFLVYNLVMLKRVKRKHEREMREVEGPEDENAYTRRV